MPLTLRVLTNKALFQETMRLQLVLFAAKRSFCSDLPPLPRDAVERSRSQKVQIGLPYAYLVVGRLASVC